uniref:Uncharacterized protein n=1 Tax=Arundo donax TaxID=35708 RepID=A0A0A9DRZ5_ARUDO
MAPVGEVAAAMRWMVAQFCCPLGRAGMFGVGVGFGFDREL